MPTESTLHARCNSCDSYRMFRLGLMQGADDLYAAWQSIQDINESTCPECNARKWSISIRLGTLPVLQRDVLVAMQIAVTSSTLTLN